jgi:hypothetical protein
VIIAAAVVVRAEERIDLDTFGKIRQEAAVRSQILRTVQVLTDRYGPRPTGSPNLKAAGEWAIAQMKLWGLQNTKMEPWEWGNSGWLNERFSAHIISPVKDHLVGEVLAWTPGTNGPVKAQAVQMVLPVRPTKEELAKYLAGYRSAVNGRIVLVGAPQVVPVSFNDPPERHDDSDVLRRLNAPERAGGPNRQGGPQNVPPERRPLTNSQLSAQLYEFLLTNGARVRVNDAGRDNGQIRAFANGTYDTAKAIPTVVLRNEDYGRIARLLGDNQTVELEFDIVNRTYPEGRTSYNAVAEIPGATDEVVMLGAHLDSWHAATGATDNAIGCAVVMEAMRILQAIGVKPRRTIRAALWSGEEQGLRGSRAYVKEHFGSFEEQKPAFAKLAGYLNIDNGTGRPRSMTVFGPQPAAAALREALAPFRDLGVLGANTTARRQGSNSDYGAFNEAGLPGIDIEQDPIHYNNYTWHTNLDTYERIFEEDAIKSATVIAAVAYHLAMRDALLPRFSKDQMPRRPNTAR